MISVKNLHKAFGPKVIYDGLDLGIRAARRTSSLAEAVKEKSVLLKHLCGLLRPDKGRIEIAGERLRLQDPKVTRVCARQSLDGLSGRRAFRFDGCAAERRLLSGRARGKAPRARNRRPCRTPPQRGQLAAHRTPDAGGIIRRHAQTRRPREGARDGAGDYSLR